MLFVLLFHQADAVLAKLFLVRQIISTVSRIRVLLIRQMLFAVFMRPLRFFDSISQINYLRLTVSSSVTQTEQTVCVDSLLTVGQ